MSDNRKIKNATQIEYEGIHFRSQLEKNVYKRLTSAGYTPEYEPDTIELLPAFVPTRAWLVDGIPQKTQKGRNKTVRRKTYTPDFRLVINDTIIYIETKGFENDRYGVERKLFLHWIETQPKDIRFVEIHNITGINRLIEKLDSWENSPD